MAFPHARARCFWTSTRPWRPACRLGAPDPSQAQYAPNPLRSHYPIEQLAEKCTFLEVAYLILFGDLPTEPELKDWVGQITHHTMLHETTKAFLEGFRYDANAGDRVMGFRHQLEAGRQFQRLVAVRHPNGEFLGETLKQLLG